MFVSGQKEMQKMDQYTIEQLGLPGVVLMENAGARVVEEILKSTTNSNPKVMILAGGGNNGGDGFVIARRLFDLGFQPQLWLLADPERINGDAKLHLDVYLNRALPLIQLQKNNINILQDELSNADIIIDAILGTGVNGPVREPLKDVISLVNTYAGKK